MRGLILLLLLASCTHSVDTASDLRINDTYALIGNPETTHCHITAQNIGTVIQITDDITVPIAEMGETEAIVCGMIDCSTEEKAASPFYHCIQIQLLQEQPEVEEKVSE